MCAPCGKTAEENFQRFDFEVINTARRNFYVDDCLKSVPSESEAIRLTADLRILLERGGFNLTKWVSNSRKLIESLPDSDRVSSFKDLLESQMPVEHALGVCWDVEGDIFCFKIEINDKPLTRRGLLSVVSSVYDPLGFAASVILPAKAILQDLCRKRLQWDDPIPTEEKER